jgi:hypothetical protein
MDLVINIVCALVGMSFGAFLSKRTKMGTGFSASVGFALLWGATYLTAKLFHISFILLPFNGGISWQKPARLLALSLLGVISALFFYIKDRNKPKEDSGDHPTALPPQS